VTNTRTVSDAKRAFYTLHTRPINAIYRRVVDELMVEMHLLTVNAEFVYNPIYALGVVTAYDRFMTGYRPETDQVSIFNALCKSVENDPAKLRHDRDAMMAAVPELTWDSLTSGAVGGELQTAMNAVAGQAKFKYSRLFAIGIYTLLEAIDPTKLKDKEAFNSALEKIAQALNLSADKIQKDLELYQSNLDKMVAAQAVMADIIAADRKKRADRELERAAKAQEQPKAEEQKSEISSEITPV
jgi:photosystem II biogenesis protein Psp29